MRMVVLVIQNQGHGALNLRAEPQLVVASTLRGFALPEN